MLVTLKEALTLNLLSLGLDPDDITKEPTMTPQWITELVKPIARALQDRQPNDFTNLTVAIETAVEIGYNRGKGLSLADNLKNQHTQVSIKKAVENAACRSDKGENWVCLVPSHVTEELAAILLKKPTTTTRES